MSGQMATGQCGQWPTESLGELTRRTRPIAYGVLKPGPYAQGGVPLLRIQDLAGNVVSTDEVHLISKELDAEYSRSRLRGGEVLLSIQGTIGRTAICPASLAGANVSRTIAVIQPDERLDPRFLRFYLLYLRERGSYDTSGSTRASLNIGTIRSMVVPVPPSVEQQRIVDLLEDHLSRLDAGTSLLSAAVRRSEAWMHAVLHDVYVTRAERERWPLVALETLATGLKAIVDGPFGSKLASRHYTESGARVVRLQNIGDGVFRPADAFISLPRYALLASHDVRESDVVVASLGDDAPRAAVVPDLGGPAIVKADCIRVRLDEGIQPEWVVWACTSRELKRWAGDRMHGVGRQRLGLTGIRNLPIPLAPAELRSGLLASIAEQATAAERLRAAIARERIRVGAMRRALLAAAFSGRLTGRSADTELVEMLAEPALAGT